jgi:hypothetical protein
VQYLSDSTQIDFEIILLDLKHYILFMQEYFPYNIQRKWIHLVALPYFFINALSKIHWGEKESITEIIIDDWYKNSTDSFYGRELVTRLSSNWRTFVVNIQSLTEIDLKTFMRIIPPFVLSFINATHILKVHGMDLRRYTYTFYKNVMEGNAIKKHYKAKLVISGNDNGMSIIKAKAAGADILLIHNGVRIPYCSHFCFKYADYNISMENMHILQARINQGCKFINYYLLGSVRLHNFLRQNSDVDLPLIYDVLWVSTCGLCDYDSKMNGYYLSTDEHKAIRIFNQFVDESSIRAAYQCRYPNEIDDLRKLGLFNNNIVYIERKGEGVYQSVAQSKVVLSSFSTVCLEAMAMGNKVGFVNLSGNKYINLIYKDLAIEYTGEGNLSFVDFYNEIRDREIDYTNYIKQSASYVNELIDIVDQAVKNGQ